MVFSNNKIEYDSTKCNGCKRCYSACFVDVIRWDESKKQPIFQYVEDCEHCSYCEIVCKQSCINVIPDFEAERVYQTFDQYR